MLSKPLIQNNRRRARLTLYLAPILFVVVVGAVTYLAGRLHPSMSWYGADFSDEESIEIFREFLRIDSSYPDGNEIPAAEFLAARLQAEGIEVHVVRLGQRNANMWAILEGKERQALVLHNHMDVEPAPEPEKWRHPPFGGVLEAPFIYGRGAFDMKSVAVAQLMSMIELKRNGTPLQRSLIFLSTGDEERFSRLGTRWLIRHRPDLVSRFYAVLTEGGAVEATDLTEVKYWGTEFGQKRFVDIWVCDASRGRLEALRAELLKREAPTHDPIPGVARFLERYSTSRDNPVYQRILARPYEMARYEGFASLPPYLKSVLRNEIVAFPVEASPEGGFEMRLILHLLPDATLEEAWGELMLDDELFSFSYVVDVPHEPGAPSDIDHPVFQAIHEFMADEMPGVEHGPLFLPWVATDARFFRLQGIASYGYSPFWILSSDTLRMKGRNERMAAPPFLDGVERYKKLVRRLVG